RHRREDAGQGNGERERAAPESAAHEVRAGDVPVLARHVPKARHHHEYERVLDDGVGQREEAERALPEYERGHGDESVRGVEIAAEQEPGDEGAETAAGESPFVKLVEVASPPTRGYE